METGGNAADFVCDRTSLGRWRCWQGKTLFTRCSSCHSVTEQNKVGPHLSGVFGRPAGTVAGASYSKAMTASGMTWNEQTLEAFLTDPTRVLPGTTMSARLPNPQDRADVIAYLKTLVSP